MGGVVRGRDRSCVGVQVRCDMLKAVAFLVACGLTVGMVVSWARQVCGWCFLGGGGRRGPWGGGVCRWDLCGKKARLVQYEW
jgi:hypothetical protein